METNLCFEQHGDFKFAVYKISDEDKIDDFGLEIIRRNKVNGLLGCTTIQINDEKIIKYNIENMFSLSDVLSNSVSENKIIKLLLNIIQTLNCLDDYMLSQDHVILGADYIFIDYEKGKTGLIYKPLESINKESKSFSRFLKEVVLDLQIDNQSECNFLNKIVNFLNENRDASIKLIGDFLSNLNRKQMATVVDEHTDRNPYGEFGIQKDLNQVRPLTFIPKDFLQKDDVSIPISLTSVPINKVQKKKKSSILSFFYKKDKNKIDKEFSSFLSVLNQNLPSQQNGPRSLNNSPNSCYKNNSVSSNQNEGTTVLNSQNASGTTVLNIINHPYIIRKKSGERFYLSNEICTIGTDKSISTIFIKNNSTISRNHATFTKKKGVVFIQDNRSTNGTYVNSQKITKGSTKKLTHGDSITIANEDFEFKTY